MASAAVSVTKDSFAQEVLQSKVPVVVDFWAEWCGPAKCLAQCWTRSRRKRETRSKW